jgi:putative ABC transport system ATP-binding protein
MPEIVRAEKINRIFDTGAGKVHALVDASVSIHTQSLTLIMGRSGSGKTTLINSLGALDTPDSGRIVFDGEDITKYTREEKDELRRTKIGFVFQSVGLISTMTALENVDFALRIAGVLAKERAERANECLHLVGLGKRTSHFPAELSGGEQQRVAIARAIAHRPKVVLADEPTGELDTQTALHVVKLFRTLIEKDRITIVMTTHDIAMKEVADKVYYLEDGRVR